MVFGNLASIVLAVAGILQVLSWTIAGATILAVLSITTLAPSRSASAETEAGHSGKRTGHSQPETKMTREKTHDKQADRPHQTPSRPEQHQLAKDDQRSSTSRPDSQKSIAPKIVPPKTVPGNVNPAKTAASKLEVQKPETIGQIPIGSVPPVPRIVKPAPVRVDPNSRVIPRGDYATYDVDLGPRIEVTCEVTATAPVNVYLMDQDNLNSLDLGEEFWSETGEETVQKATLHFVAPQSGKWILVVENTDSAEVTATAIIRKAAAKNPPAGSL